MAKKAVLHLKKGRPWLIHMGGKKRRSMIWNDKAPLPEEYGEDSGLSACALPLSEARAGDSRCGIALHPYPADIVDGFGHYFHPVEKAA
ncbi:MAG TPA: hypothetical protein PKM41_06810 [Deltaproteobacteria bacterium]|nr:hypothetical protein [Deltaproteobacteria bacterium]HOI06820.1 hypothetical protein [Deltaproteobacteria bacterium]